MYFKDFPSFLYDFKYEDGSIRTEVVKDVTRNIRVKKDILSNISVYDTYFLTDGDTPEIIAEKYYGNPEYHWIVMLANEKFDWLNDFPLTETEITKHISHVYNPNLNSREWWIDAEYHPVSGIQELILRFKIYNSPVPFDPDYITSPFSFTIAGKTTDVSFDYSLAFPDIRHGESHSSLDRLTQVFSQILPYPIGNISCLPSSKTVTGTNTQFTTNVLVGMDLYTLSGVRIGKIKSIESDSSLTLVQNSTVAITAAPFYFTIPGQPVGELSITTAGRENSPVYYVNQQGFIVNPSDVGAEAINGDVIHRQENDAKRTIKLISPALIETVIKNYEELL